MIDGDKLTAPFEIPDTWRWVKLKDVLGSYQNGYAFSAKGYVQKGIPIVSMGNISLSGRFQYNYEKCKFWNPDELQQLADFMLKKGDVIIAMTDVTPSKNLIGRMAQIDIDDKFLLNQRVGLLRIDINSAVESFIYHLGNSAFWIKYCQTISSQGAQANISTKDILNAIIPLPPLTEQQKIAQILSTVDEKIEVIGTQITRTQDLKRGLMQQLLTKGIGHTQFKDSPLGEIPESWEVKKLNEISDVVRGGSPRPAGSPELFNGDFLPWITVAELTNNPSTYVTKTKTALTELGSKQTRILAPDTVLLANSGATLGVPKILKIRAGANDGIAAFLNLSQATKHYLYHYLSSLTTYFREQLAPGSGQPNLNTSLIGNVYITLPSLEEQKKIADILNSIDGKLEILQTKSRNYKELKKGLMQQLLTGKLRVNHLIQNDVTTQPANIPAAVAS